MLAILGAAANVARGAGTVALNAVRAGARVTVNTARVGARVALNGARAGARLAGPWVRSVAAPAAHRFVTQTVPRATGDLAYAFGDWQRRKALERRAARARGETSRLAPRFWRLRRGQLMAARNGSVVAVWSTARPKKRVEVSLKAWDQFLDEVQAGKYTF